jgi:alpha-galactosidase
MLQEMNRNSNGQASARRLLGLVVGLLAALPAAGGSLLPPSQVGNLLEMTNANVRLEYDLSTGRANFYWQNALKITSFYSGAGLTSYITGTVYTNRTWTVTNNQVEITLSRGDLPTMKQIFILDQDNSFLTRVEAYGSGLQSRWMGPVVVDSAGQVDIGSYSDNRALTVPFDNDSWTVIYNAMPINNTASSYEVAAFYDNTSRNGLVVGSVTHDQWKTGVYFQGANNRLSALNVYGGVASTDTRDVLPHGLVTSNPIVSPTVFVGFGADWRTVIEAYADANAAMAPKLPWNGGVPFGWNSWYAYGTSVSYSNATAASTFIKNNLQATNFHNNGVAYINLDSYWSNLSDSQLQQFTRFCHTNGQKAGIYWTPFVYWGTAVQGSNTTMTGTSYKWGDAFLRTPTGDTQSHDSGIALDPTHPGTRQLIAYYMNYFKSYGFDFLKLDFMSHGAMEGMHYDPSVTTGIQAYNQGMQYLLTQNSGRMFLDLSIAPIFPYQYTHARRIACDTSTTISQTAFELNSVSYGWWINSRLYQFSDPDIMKFSGGSANENQSRLISCAISGTVFLNGDDLAGTTGQGLARTCLTNASINEVARAGVIFRPVEGNTGTNASAVFVRQDGSTWYVAVFNYNTYSGSQTLTLSRLGISGSYTAVDLWSGNISTVSGTTWTVNLGARQAKLFRLGAGSASAVGPTNQTVFTGASVTFSTTASGAPPFSYVWRKNGTALGQNANVLTLNPVALSDAGTYTVEVTGGSGHATNTATLTVLQPPLKWAAGNGTWDFTSVGVWTDNVGTPVVYQDGVTIALDDTASGPSPIQATLNQPVAPTSLTVSNSAIDYTISGTGSISTPAPLLKYGSGNLTLLTGSNLGGSIGIRGGTLQFGNGGTAGAIPDGYVTNNATLAINRSDVYTLPSLSAGYPALLGGPGTLKQIGSGKLVFNYQYVFGTWLSTPGQGLYIGPGSTAETVAYNPVGPVALEGGTLSAAGGASASYQSWVLTGGVTVFSNAQTAAITNNSTVNAYSQIELRDTTTFNVANGATNGIDLLVPAVLTHSYWEYGNWGTLAKTGNGKMVLTASNLYQGETIVSAGTLLVNSPGSIGAAGFPVTVQAGGHFGGTGTIYRDVNVQAGGFLEPGDGAGKVGILTVNGNLTLAGTTVLELNKSLSPSNDVVAVSSALTYGGTLTVTNPGPALVLGDSFKLFSKAGANSFGTLNLPALSAGLGWDKTQLATSGSISVAAVVPVVTVAPSTTNAECGTAVSFTANAPGASSYQWYDVQTNAISGATNPTLTLTDLHGAQAGNYTVVASNTAGSAAAVARLAGVVDTTAPMITLNGPNPMTVECHSGFTDPGSGALDACVGPVGVTVSGSVDANNPGTYTLTYTAADGNGNTSRATRTVQVVDTTAPVITWSFTNLTLSADANGQALMPDVTGTNYLLAADACSRALTLTQSPTNNALLSLGTQQVVLAVGDGNGNTAFSTNTIAVIQAVSLVPTNITVQLGNASLTLSWPADHTGWRLQAQTNASGAGLSANWGEVSGSNATNVWVVPIDTLQGGVFFRLIY